MPPDCCSAGSSPAAAAIAEARAADFDIVRQARDAVERERNEALRDLAGVRARLEERDTEISTLRRDSSATERELRELSSAHAGLKERADERDQAHARALEQLQQHFDAAAAKVLESAQRQFLERADARFRQSEEASGQKLAQLLQPVSERLQRYEEGVHKVEAERRDAFGDLKGQIEAMRIGQERVSGEAAKLVNALRNAPKARGRWGEQQLRNVLESCGLSEHTDFAMEVSVADGEGGRLRPDAIVRVPGGKSLIIDAKVSLNAYQDAFGAVDEAERLTGLGAHAGSIRAHINGLSAKSYWSQFDDAPDYVIMFIPGEHFLSAALEHDHELWQYAFDKRRRPCSQRTVSNRPSPYCKPRSRIGSNSPGTPSTSAGGARFTRRPRTLAACPGPWCGFRPARAASRSRRRCRRRCETALRPGTASRSGSGC